jgi:hypothetical protein
MQTMDNENYKDLIRQAWELYALTAKVQKLLNRLFFDEFMELDNAEFEKRCRESYELPF